MNKKLTLASALLAASAVYAFDTWIGNQSVYQIDTGLDNKTNTSGYWFSYADDSDGGKSEVQWPAPLGNDYSETALDQVIDYCGGVCGTAVLDKGDLSYDPFVGIGFNVAGENKDNKNKTDPADASDWGGICITYTSDISPELELGLGDYDSKIEYANPSASLPKAATKAVSKAVAWSGFAQPAWYKGDVTITGPEAAKQLVAVKFKLQNKNGSYKFNICGIGPFDGSCPTDCESGSAIQSVRGASSVKALLSGRTLSFSGVKSSATAEVMNLQGQVVAKGDASSAMNLAALDAGVYVIRVAGKSVNFTNKIVLK